MYKQLIALCFFMIFSLSVFASSIYVNVNTGNDNWTGANPNYTSGNNGPKKSIQAAIDIAQNNDVIYVSNGIYIENISIKNKYFTLIGYGSGTDTAFNTIIKSPVPGKGTGIAISNAGINASNRIMLKDLRVENFQYGVELSSFSLYENIASVNNSTYGFWQGSNNRIIDIQMIACKMLDNQSGGLYIGHDCFVRKWYMDNCLFENNIYGGMYIFSDNPSTANVKNLILRNSTFKNNLRKGIYAEKLDSVLFENLKFDSCGTDTSYNWNAAMDINLKYKSYKNIQVKNCEFSACGIGGGKNSGCAMVIKARDDGTVYDANPAKLDSVLVAKVKIHNCPNGLIFGEPGKSNFGPTHVIIQESNITKNTYNLVSNIKSDILAHNNWWTNNGPVMGDTLTKQSGKIHVIDWLVYDTDQNNFKRGFQPINLTTFDDSIYSLQQAIDVCLENYSLLVPRKYYPGDYLVWKNMLLRPSYGVSISEIMIDTGKQVWLESDLLIKKSITIGPGAFLGTYFSTITLDTFASISEPVGNPVWGRVQACRFIDQPKQSEDFGNMGIEISANKQMPYPGKTCVTRITGPEANLKASHIHRIFEIDAAKNCLLNANARFYYDFTEAFDIQNYSEIKAGHSYDTLKDWSFHDCQVDSQDFFIDIAHIDALTKYWTFFDTNRNTVPTGMQINYDLVHNKCFGDSNGSITAHIATKYPGLQYEWSNGDTGLSIQNLPAGIYRFKLSDTAGCEYKDTLEIVQEDEITIVFETQDVRCAGQKNGSINTMIKGGKKPYQFFWSTWDTSRSISGLPKGFYELRVSDSNNCLKLDTAWIYEPGPLKIQINKTEVSCFGFSDGAIQAIIQGGTPGYHLMWSTGDSNKNLNGLSAGKYYLDIRDSNGCHLEDSFLITQPAPLKLDISTYPDTNNLCVGRAEASVSGGTKPYQYLWSDPASQTGFFADSLCSDSIRLSLTDSHLCVTDSQVFIGNYINSISEVKFNKLNIFPNPGKGSFKIETRHPLVKILVYDSRGSLIMEKKVKATQRQELKLNNGMYLIKGLDVLGNIYYGKLMIQH